MVAFSERLQGLTNANGFFKKQVANGAGVPFNTYRRYASGEREPSASTVATLAQFFNVSADYLLGLSDEPRLPDAETLRIAKEIQAMQARKSEEQNK